MKTDSVTIGILDCGNALLEWEISGSFTSEIIKSSAYNDSGI